MRRLLNMVVVWLGALAANSAAAHPSPSSALLLDFHRGDVSAELRLPLIELEIGFGKPLLAAPGNVVAQYRQALAEYVEQHIQPVAPDGRAWAVLIRDMAVDMDQQPLDLVVHLDLRPPAGAPVRRFELNYDVIAHEVVSHTTLVSVRSDFSDGLFSDKPQLLGSLHFLHKTIAIDRGDGSIWRGFRGVFGLGMSHIAEGSDHLLFLLTLLLPAPLLAARGRWGGFGGGRRGLVALFKIVSAFTIGHSLTLFAGTAGWLHPPARYVEVVIALSIFVSALHAIRPLFPRREALIAGAFGLVHGLAFAATLGDLGLDGASLAAGVFGFNLGIEAMQLLVVAAAAPWLMLLARTAAYAALRTVGGVAAAIAALAWMAQRAFDWPNPLDAWISVAAAHPLTLLALLAAFAVAVWGSSASLPLPPRDPTRRPDDGRPEYLDVWTSK